MIQFSLNVKVNSFGLRLSRLGSLKVFLGRSLSMGFSGKVFQRLKSSSFVGILKGIDVFLLKKRCLKNDKCAKYLKY